MKRLSLILVVVGGLLYCSTSKANITNVVFQSDGDGAIIDCPVYTWSGDVSSLSVPIKGDQLWGPAHVSGIIDTTGPIGDPSLTISSAIVNDTAFTWTAYQVNVYMNNSFTLSGQAVTLPPDWGATIAQAPAWNGTQYEGQLLFTAGTPVMVGDELDFGYTVSFSGATSFVFTQEMIPIPEPGTFGFLAVGALLLGATLTAGRRKTHS